MSQRKSNYVFRDIEKKRDSNYILEKREESISKMSKFNRAPFTLAFASFHMKSFSTRFSEKKIIKKKKKVENMQEAFSSFVCPI